MKTKDISICAISIGMLVIGSKIVIPISFIPLTLQTLVVILLGLLLTRKQVIMTFGIFLLAGLCGLPVFANGGGPAYILQPSFGFLLSFPIAAYLLASYRSFYKDSILRMIGCSLLALCFIYLIGAMYMFLIFKTVLLLDKSIMDILMIGVIPFIINDTISASIACIVAKRLYIPLHAILTPTSTKVI